MPVETNRRLCVRDEADEAVEGNASTAESEPAPQTRFDFVVLLWMLLSGHTAEPLIASCFLE